MLTDLSTLPSGTKLSYDLVIIGAGAAGITLARDLQDVGLRIGLFEAGGLEQTDVSAHRYRGPLTLGRNVDYADLDVTRLRFLGGTTNHWGGWSRPFEPNVFRSRPGTVEIGWPVDRSDLDPYYVRAHEILNLGRFVYSPTELLGDALPNFFRTSDILDPLAWRFSDPPVRFREMLLEESIDDRVDVWLDANCVDIAVERQWVSHVLFSSGGEHRVRVDANTVVVACGGIESVRQLLMIERKHAPGLNPSGLLGSGFMEHPHVRAGTIAVDPSIMVAEDPSTASLVGRVTDVDGTSFTVAAGLNEGYLAKYGLVNASFALGPVNLDNLATMDNGIAIETLHSLWRPESPGVVGFFARSEMRPDPRSRVALTSQLDDLGMPRAGLRLEYSDADMDDIRRSFEAIALELMKAGFGPAHSLLLGDPTVKAGGGAHHMGGARMHEDERHGVVDPDLRCHAVENLYVASAATFPTSCFSNPTLTIVAMAIRLADHLRTHA